MTAPRLRRALAATALIGTLGAVGCSALPAEPGRSDAVGGPRLDGELTIFAAASLSGAFDRLAADFEDLHPGVDVRPISYDGSSVLAVQLLEGASADVFAAADEKNMTKVVDAGLAVDPETFATNTLQIAVAPGNPESIHSLDALAEDGLTVVLCAPEVPCGTAAHTLLDAAGVALTPASEEQNVTAVLSTVKSGEADAGLVYRTDILAAGGDVAGIDIAGAERATNVYPLVSLEDAANPDAADAFVAFVLSDAGRQVLADFGFGAP
ncbi:MAG: molybdate ABC transporter substrate-binding protein [Microbacterium sp.]|uniref:molybdate ABC transporter substrate-binding protein n=1 Tax=Microbacterium sp. TaxID=51671 RepID=UPI003BAE88A3